MKKLLFWGLFSTLSWSFNRGQALALDMSLTSASADLGDAVNVELNISGLGDGVAPSLGAFDLNVDYDDSILDFQSLIYGDQLSSFGFGSFQDFS